MALCEEGKADEALQATAQMVDLSNSLKGTPNLISLLVRVSIDSMALGAVERTIYDSTPSASACRALTEKLAQMDLKSAFARAPGDDQVVRLDLLRATAKGPRAFSDWLIIRGSPAPPPSALEEQLAQPTFGLLRWWLAGEMLFSVKATELYEQQLRLPFFEHDAGLSPELRHIQRQLESRSLWRPHMFAYIDASMWDMMYGKRASTEAQVGLARIALLLKVYRWERGHYPESLEELERFAGKPLPLDPCSGQAFHYRRNGSGFILYSVGTDGVDDSGKVSVRAGQEGPIPPLSSQKGADIVWVCKE
jgi:hypothetical protein